MHMAIANMLTLHHVATSRTLCMLHCGMPTSTVLIPVFAEIMGPMVLPHPMSLLTTNSWHGIPLFVPHSLNKVAVTEFVAYLQVKRESGSR